MVFSSTPESECTISDEEAFNGKGEEDEGPEAAEKIPLTSGGGGGGAGVEEEEAAVVCLMKMSDEVEEEGPEATEKILLTSGRGGGGEDT
jgi:hypothetical protein